jgi:hypothetical protein
MADTGLKAPTATGGKYNDFSDPSYAYVYDADEAYAAVSNNSYKRQSYETYAFGVPAGATINGIAAKIYHRESVTGSPFRCYVAIYRASGTQWSSGNSGTITYGESYTDYREENFGNSTDKWGLTGWVATDFSDANFSMYWEINTDDTDAITTRLNLMSVTVYYTPAGFANIKPLGIAGANISKVSGIAVASISKFNGVVV